LKRSRAKQADLSKKDLTLVPKELLQLPLEGLNLSGNRIA
jgi:hypothetical protein